MARRTRTYSLSQPICHGLFDKHVPHADVKPRVLFACGKKDKWASISKHKHLISDLLDHTDGRIAAFKSLHSHLRTWLAEHGHEWVRTDSERSAYSLKNMMGSLKARKRNYKKAPLRFPSLQVLVDKMHDSEVDSASASADDEQHDEAEITLHRGPRQLQVSISSTSDRDDQPAKFSTPVSRMISTDDIHELAQSMWDERAPPRPPTPSTPLLEHPGPADPTQVTDRELLSLVLKSSVDLEPPLPGDYREVFKKPAAARTMLKRPASLLKKPAAATLDLEMEAGTPLKRKPAAAMDDLEMEAGTPDKVVLPACPPHLDELLLPYVRLAGVARPIVRKRVHGRLWHWAREHGVDTKVVTSAGLARSSELESY